MQLPLHGYQPKRIITTFYICSMETRNKIPICYTQRRQKNEYIKYKRKNKINDTQKKRKRGKNY